MHNTKLKPNQKGTVMSRYGMHNYVAYSNTRLISMDIRMPPLLLMHTAVRICIRDKSTSVYVYHVGTSLHVT